MLPEMDGFEICKTLRLEPATARTPILMLTAKAAEIDRVLGLELGADDYLTKPFSPRELLLRIKKILARGATEEKPKDQIRFGDLLIDVPRHLASWKGKAIELTATEFKLLTVLAQRAGRVQSRDHLLRDVWEYDSLIDTRTVDTHMRRLREKLGAASKHLDTVRGSRLSVCGIMWSLLFILALGATIAIHFLVAQEICRIGKPAPGGRLKTHNVATSRQALTPRRSSKCFSTR